MIYGESDYWVARYKTLTEGSLKQTYGAKDCHWGRQGRGTALLTDLFDASLVVAARKEPSSMGAHRDIPEPRSAFAVLLGWALTVLDALVPAYAVGGHEGSHVTRRN